MRPRLVFHIGSEKTGTKSIQETLSRHRGALEASGICYPASPGARNHVWLALLVGEDRMVGDLTGLLDRPVPDLEAGRAGFRAAFAAEMAQLPDSIHTVVLSNEHCHGRLRRREEIRALRAFLAPHFASVRICLYIRRQDRLAVSAYSTRLRSAVVSEQIFPAVSPVDWYFNYFRMANVWASVFGPEALDIRVYERSELLGQDVTVDFLRRLGIADLGAFTLGHEANPSLSAAGQAVLLEFNRQARQPGLARDRRLQLALSQMRSRLAAALERQLQGPPRMPARPEARAFYRHFAGSNERLRQAYMPDREAVFDLEFGEYPETEAPTAPDVAALGQVMAGLLIRQATEARAAELRSARTAARALATARTGDMDAALALLAELAGEPSPPIAATR